ncbi:hypothetical protein VOLCADRAFT_91142 [Volvox carteri f. nagariensis]|uniref:Uncharacterized protein n=1 Tax=Volvox carteri f. nagariensis TaxID=3068 RepID=D8TWA4_VOLCA|nr:uncharacterized protein VOLCADRAFT_91142 [Volvox carteri f. nagariensis]EFJ48441.1 hypothetical protein VOLCADRAFT_91142 [Volvox carteri f. nagariensis]|eukprot:XP_002950695.1 hypothetical protein VOLCADRAFT_91142 [Volvox carteri f. nagariensis]
MASRGDWSTELWDICAQPGGPNMCCLSLWCPCIQYGLLLEQLPPGSVTCAGSVVGGCALFCVLWVLGDLLGAALLTKVFTLPCTALVHAHTRGYIRRKYGIQSHPLHDCLVTWCCAPCALCQEVREVVVRQAAEREDQPRTPLLMCRSGSGHDRADLSARSSPAGSRAASGLVPMGSAPEPPTSPAGGGSAATAATSSSSATATAMVTFSVAGISESHSGISAEKGGLEGRVSGSCCHEVGSPSQLPQRASGRAGGLLAAGVSSPNAGTGVSGTVAGAGVATVTATSATAGGGGGGGGPSLGGALQADAALVSPPAVSGRGPHAAAMAGAASSQQPGGPRVRG